ncbi:MAG: hypothetical protein HKP61_05000 [Dactylosporangium sp.]|nr:hypothetical protein [Dactylosporangium sp.]NNJ60304.1 hypothetical protein [Dactylosporangium sp.]
MVDPTFVGDPGGIIRAGWRVRDLAEQLAGEVTSRQVGLTVPGGTNAPWAHASVATAVTTDWQTYLAGLAGEVGTFGADAVTAGTGYRLADDEAARRMR